MRSFHSLRRYWGLLAHYLRPQWVGMLLLALTLAGAIAVQVATPLVVSRFVDQASAGAAFSTLVLLSLVAVGLALFGQAAAVAETWVAERVSWSATNTLRTDLLEHVLRLDASFHTAHTPGELIQRIDGDVSALARFFSRFVVYVVGNGILILVVLGLLFDLDWRIGLALALVVLLGLLVMMRVRTLAAASWARERQVGAEFYGFLGEYLAGLEDVRSSGARGFVLRRCAEIMRGWLAVSRRAEKWGYVIVTSSQGLFAIGTALAFALCAMLYHDGTLTIGAVYLVVQYIAVLRQPTEQIRNEVQDLQQADASIDRIETLLATQPLLRDGSLATLPPGPLGVELECVSFGYAPQTPVLREVSLTLAPGRILGVVGRTGSGKTTLTRLLPRFYDPTDGVVRLGGVDLREVRIEAVRERIGLVSQEVHLFDASVRDNLALFDPSIDDERIRAVLIDLGLGDWLATLPLGLATPLGHGGVGLSAGQGQVLACARVFLRDPDIVILDEASSRLDPATERLVHFALERLLAGRTGIIIAHRLATIGFADDILVLEDGRVREHGQRLALEADPDSRFAELLRVAAEEAVR